MVVSQFGVVAAGYAGTSFIAVVLISKSRREAAEGLALFALAACWVTLPSFVPKGFNVSGKTIFFSDILLPIAAIAVFKSVSWRQPTRTKLFLIILLFTTVMGLLRGAATKFLVADLRGPLYLISGYFIASVFAENPRRLLKTASLIVISGAALVLFSSLSGTAFVAGRAEEVVTAGSQDLSATRFLVPSTYLALAVACGLVSYALLQRLPKMALIVAGGCAALLFLAFSRNDLLTITTAVIFVAASVRSVRLLVRALGGVLAVIGVVAICLGFLSILPSKGLHDFAARQARTYSARVLGGLSSSARRLDSSAQSRVIESGYAWKTIREFPVLGKGWGTLYRPPLQNMGNDKFWLDDGRGYVHNGFLWFWTKAGLVGLFGFVWFAFAPVWRVFRKSFETRPNCEEIALAATLIGLLAGTIFVPHPFGVATAPTMGLIIGLLTWRKTFEAPALRSQQVSISAVARPGASGDDEEEEATLVDRVPGGTLAITTLGKTRPLWGRC